MQVIWIIVILIYYFGFVLHITGILAIISSNNRSNQTLILFNLSIADILLLLWNISIRFHQYATFDPKYYYDDQKKMLAVLQNIPSTIYKEVNDGTWYCFAFQLFLIMSVLTIDLLVCVTKPVYYNTCMKESIFLRKVLVAAWLYSVVVGIVYGVFPVTQNILYMIGMVLGAAYFVLAFVTYGVIIWRIHVSRNRAGLGRTTSRTSSKLYVVSGLIVGTFFLFYLIPIITRHSIRISMRLTREKCLLHEGLLLMPGFGLVCDALIYIFFKQEFRDIFNSWFCRGRNRHHVHQFNTHNRVENINV